MDITEKIKTLARWINESNDIVAFTGAGVSTESGLPDFRSPDGLYNLGTNSPISTVNGQLVPKIYKKLDVENHARHLVILHMNFLDD